MLLCRNVIHRIVGVTVRIERVEGVAIVVVEWYAQRDALRQVRIGDEPPREPDQIGVASDDGFFCGSGLEAPGGDDRPVKERPERLCGDWALPLGDELESAHARLDHVQI